MPFFKRGRGAPRLKARRAKAKKNLGKKRKFTTGMRGLSQLRRRVAQISRTIETKSGVTNITDNIALRHNNQVIVNSALLETQNGVQDMELNSLFLDVNSPEAVSFNMKMMLNSLSSSTIT